jgi:hypothetical protein
MGKAMTGDHVSHLLIETAGIHRIGTLPPTMVQASPGGCPKEALRERIQVQQAKKIGWPSSLN